MIARSGLTLSFLLAGTAACAPVEPAPPRNPVVVAPAAQGAALERELVALLNQHRSRMRLAPLQQDSRLDALAREHSQAMAARRRAFGHDGFDGRATAAAREIPHQAFAENVAYNSRTGPELATSLTAGWLASPGHRRNIEGTYDLTGMGSARSSDGVTYVTQLFVRR